MISPVLDTSLTLRVFTTGDDSSVTFRDIPLPRSGRETAPCISVHTDVLICGALSCGLEWEIRQHGVRLYPWVMGECGTVLDAYRKGIITSGEFAMPGCRGRCGRHGERSRKREKRKNI
jgi:hypothetical protein